MEDKAVREGACPRIRRNERVPVQQVRLELLPVRYGLGEARVRLRISDQLRNVRNEDVLQPLHVQQPLAWQEHAPPDLAIRESAGPP